MDGVSKYDPSIFGWLNIAKAKVLFAGELRCSILNEPLKKNPLQSALNL